MKKRVLLELTPSEAKTIGSWLILSRSLSDVEDDPRDAEKCVEVARRIGALVQTETKPSLQEIAETMRAAAREILELSCACAGQGPRGHGRDCVGRQRSSNYFTMADTIGRRG